jgi:large subunit ribosomal protein L21
MYAIIATGGKQYRVSAGEICNIEKLDNGVGNTVEFDKILMVANGEQIDIGAPYLTNVKVTGEVVEQGRGDKVHIIKFRRRKHYMRRAGHRQDFTAVKITAIEKK